MGRGGILCKGVPELLELLGLLLKRPEHLLLRYPPFLLQPELVLHLLLQHLLLLLLLLPLLLLLLM